MDTSQGSPGPLIAGIGGAALIILLFLPWFGGDAGNFSAWERFALSDIFFLITGLVAIGAALAAGGRLLPGLSLSGAAALLGGIATILMLWLLIFDWPEGASRMFWAFLALIACAAIAYGGASSAEEA